ncbi:MAG: serine/threonine-protein kinase [Rubrivivax sp.]
MTRESTPETGAIARGRDRPQHMLGPYRLLRLLGKGGLGEVFEAQGPDGRTVAVKAFRLQDDEQGLAAGAFVREASLGQRLQHPDIVRVFDSGCHGDYAYLAMEFVPGHDLRVHTRRGELLPLPRLLHIAERVARAVAAAHAINVIHRDLKPGNVLLDDAGDRVKVTDFGLARLGDAFRSRTGIIAGTPGYMSPEQLAEVPLGPASDLYALGVMLFELLTARLPHEAHSLGELLIKVTSRAAPRLHTLRRDVPAALDRLVARLLERRPEDRPASAAEVADELAAIRAALTPAA